jgi:hypothetical protein
MHDHLQHTLRCLPGGGASARPGAGDVVELIVPKRGGRARRLHPELEPRAGSVPADRA